MTKIIAECAANHCGKRDIMLATIKAAALVGVDVVKFQSFKADTLRRDWPDHENAYQYYKEHELSEDDHIWLMTKCKEHKVEFLTTVTDLPTVDFLCQIGLKTVKIASPDCNNWPLISMCLSKFDRVLISTGLHTPEQIRDLADFVSKQRAMTKVTVLHCVSLYPTPLDKANLLHIGNLMGMFDSVGFSDHTLGVDVAKMALCLGVACVEKHFTLNRKLPGKDQAISSTKAELREIVNWRDKVAKAMYCADNEADRNNRGYIGRWSGQ